MDDPRHLLRFLKAQAVGGSEDAAATAIAKSERVSVETVKKSIREVDAFRQRNDRAQFDLALRDLVISVVPQAKETLHGLLAATELVEIKDHKTGKVSVREMDDKTTRLEAVRVVNSLVNTLQPKVPMIAQTIEQHNQTAQLNTGTETNEERMRRLRQKAQEHNLLPPEVAGVPKYLDEGEDDPDLEEDEGDEEDDLEGKDNE